MKKEDIYDKHRKIIEANKKKTLAYQKDIEEIINLIWWKLEKIEWTRDGVKVTTCDQGGHPFVCFHMNVVIDEPVKYRLIKNTLKSIKKAWKL